MARTSGSQSLQLSTTGQGYSGTSTYGERCVGKGAGTYTDNTIFVSRYAFTTDAYGATSISFQTSNASDLFQAQTGGDSIAKIRFAISTNASAYVNKMNDTGYGYPANMSYQYGSYIRGTLSIKLLPNTTYYLWIFPGTQFAGRFRLGSCTVTITGTYGQPSSISAADGYFGDAIPITLIKSVNGVTHDVTVSCAGRSETLGQQSADTAFTWTPDLAAYAAALPNANSAVATITVKTWYGTADWGSSTKTITVSFKDTDLQPVLGNGWVSLAAYNSDGATAGARALRIYVQGLSKVQASFDASKIQTQYGATVVSYSLTVEGSTDAGATLLESDVLTGAGTVTVTATATDSRGHTARQELSITVESYAQPRLTDVSIFRCDSNGAASESGTYVSARAKAVISSLAGNNRASLIPAKRAYSAASFTELSAMSSEVVSILDNFSADLTWVVRLRCTDLLGNMAELTVTVPGQQWLIKGLMQTDANTGAKSLTAVGIGKAPESTQVLEIPAGWAVKRGQQHALFSGDQEWTGALADISEVQEKTENLPSGLLIQYGTVTTGSDGLATVTFYTPFSAAPIVLVDLQGNSTNIFDARPYNITTTGFEVTARRYNGSSISATAVTAHWIAIGIGT